MSRYSRRGLGYPGLASARCSRCCFGHIEVAFVARFQLSIRWTTGEGELGCPETACQAYTVEVTLRGLLGLFAWVHPDVGLSYCRSAILSGAFALKSLAKACRARIRPGLEASDNPR